MAATQAASLALTRLRCKVEEQKKDLETFLARQERSQQQINALTQARQTCAVHALLRILTRRRCLFVATNANIHGLIYTGEASAARAAERMQADTR